MAATSTARVRHAPVGKARSFAIFGSVLTFLNEPEEDGAAVFMFEHRELPNSGVGAHREPNQESWYVLEGTLDVEVEGDRYHLGPGDFLSVAPGVAHSLHNPGPGLMRTITTVWPGTAHPRFFTSAGEPVDLLNPPTQPVVTDPQRLMAAARQCGIEFVPPSNQ